MVKADGANVMEFSIENIQWHNVFNLHVVDSDFQFPRKFIGPVNPWYMKAQETFHVSVGIYGAFHGWMWLKSEPRLSKSISRWKKKLSDPSEHELPVAYAQSQCWSLSHQHTTHGTWIIVKPRSDYQCRDTTNLYLSGCRSRLAVPWQLPIRKIKAHSTAEYCCSTAFLATSFPLL